MAAPESKSIPELIALYGLEPDLRDIYVEGLHDREFVTWYLRRANLLLGSVVYEIDTVDVPSELCDKYSLGSGKRSEVMALAFELSTLLNQQSMEQVMCVVDKDLDVLDWQWDAHPVLFGTDYAAMESYGFTENALSKVLLSFAPNLGVTIGHVMASFEEILIHLFALRLVNQLERWRVTWMPHTRCCTLHDGVPLFDVDDYVGRLLNYAGRIAESDDFLEDFRQESGRLTGDARFFVHGHDFAHLLGWYLRQVVPRSRCSEDEARRSIMLSVEFADLRAEFLFQQIEARNT